MNTQPLAGSQEREVEVRAGWGMLGVNIVLLLVGVSFLMG